MAPVRIFSALLLTLSACASSASSSKVSSIAETSDAQPVAVAEYNLEDGVALDGYDPVSYFDGTVPVMGTSTYGAKYRGVVYFFDSEAHRTAFLAEPRRYEPAYGGWCAWAMANGGKTVDADPTNFTIEDGVLRVFYRNAVVDTRAKWQKGNLPELRASAAEEWSARSGEPLDHLALR